MKIKDALDARIPRVRKPIWAGENVYLRLPLLANGMCGPWAELYDEYVQPEVLGVPVGSQKMLVFEILEEDGFEVYAGKPSEHEQYNYSKLYLEK